MRLIDLKDDVTIAYFSMEVGLDPLLPTYSGGLGVLAGDTLRSAADLEVPMVGVSLIHRKGYFEQKLDEAGNQSEEPVEWEPEKFLEKILCDMEVEIEGRAVKVSVWRYEVTGVTGHVVPVLFLDTSMENNDPFDRTLTDHLYGGDDHYRLCQETILGVGGVSVLDSLGYSGDVHYHMNEGHSALLTLALLEKEASGRALAEVSEVDIEAVRKRCIFTTHTPVPAGHDKFPIEMAEAVLGKERSDALVAINATDDNTLNMTYLALFFSRYINGVAMRHGAVSRDMFPHHPINAITNGVHAMTWASEPFRELFDSRTWGWRTDNFYLRYAMEIPLEVIQETHAIAKGRLIEEVKKRTGVGLDPDVMTLGVARRATPYKRLDLILSDKARLKGIAEKAGPLQIIYAGKAHPMDEPGKDTIRRIFDAARELKDTVTVVYLENYEMGIASKLCSGVDLWINTPLRPREASGTSGMKAALNGVPSFSTHDGWWVEGHVEGVTGWAIGSEEHDAPEDQALEIEDMYDKLERVILPTFYKEPLKYAKIMRSSIAFNGSFFNTQRMLTQYLCNAYFPKGDRRKS